MSNPFLIGKKTVLRPISLDDTATLNRWINNPETRKYLVTNFPISAIAEKAWIEKQSEMKANPSDVTFVIETLDEKRMIGTMGLHRIDWVNRNASTGTMIGEQDDRKKGYATDAKMTLLQYAFETLGMHKITSHAFAENAASIGYSKRCGYTVEANLKEEIFREGKWHDVVLLACFYDSWKNVAKEMKQ